ncbi:putative membrane protein YdfK [anaerobic digester metagenome]
MLGVIVNVIVIILGSGIGLVFNKGIPERVSETLMKGLGLCTLYIGWSGALKGSNTLVLIVSMAIGIVIGEGLNLDARLNRFADRLEKRFSRKDGSISIAEGFITASLLFCVGAMTVVGSLQAGLSGNYEMLYTKSVLDFISSMIFASTLGIGVMLSSIFVLVFQGGIVLLAQVVAPFLTDGVVAEMTCVGSVLIFALGLNIVGITKLKVLNFLPAMFLPILLTPLLAQII